MLEMTLFLQVNKISHNLYPFRHTHTCMPVFDYLSGKTMIVRVKFLA